MSTKNRAGIAGAVAVIVLLGFQSIEHWSLVDSVLTRLRGMGSAGSFIAAVLMSRLLPLSLAIAALLSSLSGRKEKEFGPPSQVPPINNSPTQTVNASPHIELHVGSQVQKPSPAQETKKDIARISSLRAKEVLLRKSPLGVWHEASTDLELTYRGIVVPFKNVPNQVGEQTPRGASVTANLVFRQKHASEELHISHGVWLNHYEYFAMFDSGETHYLLIAVKLIPFVTFENPNSSNPFNQGRFRSNMTVHHPQAMTLPPEGQVEIVLVDSKNVTVFQGEFDYALSVENMTVTPKPS